MKDKVLDHTLHRLARQVLVLRRKAVSPRTRKSSRLYARREQRELYERLKAIMAAEKEVDPLIDDISLEEIGLTGETPAEADDDRELIIRLENAENGGRPRLRLKGARPAQTKNQQTTYAEVIMSEMVERVNPETVGNLPAEPAVKKRKYSRRGKSEPATPPATNGEVHLTAEQLSKLWQAVTGGQIRVDAEHRLFHVTLESFSLALPALLEKL